MLIIISTFRYWKGCEYLSPLWQYHLLNICTGLARIELATFYANLNAPNDQHRIPFKEVCDDRRQVCGGGLRPSQYHTSLRFLFERCIPPSANSSACGEGTAVDRFRDI